MMPILILAAGAASRMRGTDKLLLHVDGAPLLRRMAALALTQGADVRITLPAAPHPRYTVLEGLPVQTIAVPDAAQGISASLRRGITSLGPEVTHVMLLLADLPDLTAQDLRQVRQAVAAHPDASVWRAATPEGKGGHPMIIARQLFDAFATRTGDSGGHSVLQGERVHLVTLADARARADLDTPEAWAAWRAARAALTSADPR
ncbi:MAG: nucleotidyltransferase family protein [Pseudomonadota bacterium]